MSVPARSESPLASRTMRAAAANDGYGSLMGMGASRKKKKPVLVLDADEIAKAHLEMAAGGAQIMEEAADPDYVERPRAPSSLLGLAPMDADDAEAEDASAYPPIPDASSWEDEDEAPLPQIPEDFTYEGEPDEEPEEPEQAYNLDHLLRPSSAEREEQDEERESVIPSIEEQLKRMRALPTALSEEEAAAQQPFVQEPPADEPATPQRAGPMERLHQMGFGADGFGLTSGGDAGPEDDWAASDWDDAEPASEEPAAEEELANEEPLDLTGNDFADETLEPEAEEDEPFDLEIEAEPVVEAAPEPEPEPEPVFELQDHVEAVHHFDDADDGPDFSWMEPEERRQLHIASGEHSSLRARLVQAEEGEGEEAQQPSLLQRFMNWVAGLFGR